MLGCRPIGMGTSPDTTTIRLRDTAAGVRTRRTWLAWANVNGAAPVLLGTEKCVIGRGTEADFRLDCSGVSRRHVELYRQGPLFGVRDLDSTNGTFLNGQRLEAAAALSPNDVLRVGEAVAVVVSCEGDEPPGLDRPLPGLLFGPGMAEVRRTLGQVAPGTLSVVLEGPTGCGKEGLAKLLHAESGRRGKLQAVNCAALPPALAEAELFGHRKGAFTGAEQPGLGHVRAAQGGTLFLDELYDLARPVQAKLLRVIQEQQVIPLGETRPIAVDFRLVVASPVPIADLVARGHLREDLAARLSGVVINVPRLSERRADISLLFAHFLDRYSGGRAPAVDARLLEQLLLADWPGNVRELEQLTRRLLALHGGEKVLRRSHWGAEVRVSQPLPAAAPARPSSERASEDLERLRAAFARHQNLARAAREAGISRQRAYRLLGDRPGSSLLDDEQPSLAPTQAGSSGRGDTGS